MVHRMYAKLLETAHVVGHRIAKARVAKRPGGWSQTDLAEELATRGILDLTAKQWLTRIKNYETTPPRTVPPPFVERSIEDALGLERGWLSADVEQIRWRSSTANAEIAPATATNLINLVPYWGLVPCGEWEQPDPGAEDLIQVSDRIEDTRGVIAIRVRGNSMLPLFSPGEVVSVRLGSEKLDGVVTLARNQDSELTLKLMKFVGGVWELHSINPEYGNASADSVTILGHAIYREGGDPSGIRA